MCILDSSKAYQYYFEEITKIPRGSSNEQAISNYIVLFAKENGLAYVQDKIGNVVIYKEATSGYETHECVMLQSHIDMVCESSGSGSFDFENDPLNIYIEDGFLKAKGTTLGADDGAGVAMILSVLADKSLKHPALEGIFTVQEETTMEGAFKFDESLLKGKRMINIDGEEEHVTNTAAAGGTDVLLNKAIMLMDQKDTMYELLIAGFSGGHSGAEIHKEKGNALKVMGRVLRTINKKFPVLIANLEGGQKINAIPREASALIGVDASIEEIKELVESIVSDIQNEYKYGPDKHILYDLRAVKSKHSCANLKDSANIINTLCLLPTGVRSFSKDLNLTMSSCNVGVFSINNNIVNIECSIRGASDSYVRDIEEEYICLGALLGYEVKPDNWYPSFDYLEDSTLRKIMNDVYFKLNGENLVMEAIHGGLECGIFKNKMHDIDIVTMGPNMYDVHSPSEKLEIASFDRSYNFLIKFLEAL